MNDKNQVSYADAIARLSTGAMLQPEQAKPLFAVLEQNRAKHDIEVRTVRLRYVGFLKAHYVQNKEVLSKTTTQNAWIASILSVKEKMIERLVSLAAIVDQFPDERKNTSSLEEIKSAYQIVKDKDGKQVRLENGQWQYEPKPEQVEFSKMSPMEQLASLQKQLAAAEKQRLSVVARIKSLKQEIAARDPETGKVKDAVAA